MTANEVLCKLQNAANDGEAQIVEDLAIKAGFWWKCEAEIAVKAWWKREAKTAAEHRPEGLQMRPCYCVNVESESECQECGSMRVG